MTSTACSSCLRRTLLVRMLSGRIEIARLQRRSLREVLSLSDAELLQAVGGPQSAALEARWRALSSGVLLDEAHAVGLTAICRHDAAYPRSLRDDRSAAAVLFVAGADEPLHRMAALVGTAEGAVPTTVAIVGTRRASPEGMDVARALGRGLAAAGVTVVSGMALGIDSAAHEGALEGGGRTVAVLAGGADVAYPSRKLALHRRLSAAALVVSEMPPGFRAYRWCFPARNRTIAALAQATVVVEAAGRSGSLITAELALELGRDVGAVPGPVSSWRSDGTNALLRDGATLIRDARDVLDLVLGVGAGPAAQRAGAAPVAAPPDLAPRLVALLAAVEDGRDSVGALVSDADGAGEVRAGLVELELLGLVRRGPGGRVRRVVVGASGVGR